MDEDKFKDVIQSCHLNFLIGSGLSAPYLQTVGVIEKYLTELENASSICNEIKEVATVSILKKYYDGAIKKNYDMLIKDDESATVVLNNYIRFLKSLNEIVLHRKTNILNKQINLFTTNHDIFLEKSLEESNLEYNDGFTGRLKPYFELSSFKKSIYKVSQHYENISELPLFNVYKMHGSLTWKFVEEEKIEFDNSLLSIKKINDIKFSSSQIVKLSEKKNDHNGKSKIILKRMEKIIDESQKISLSKNHTDFLKLYNELLIVNPTKEKFKSTTLNYTYYELLRIFSNELEKENSVLFVMGFSFSDEHIREITLRAINSNPTLIVCVFAFDEKSESEIKKNLKVSNRKQRYDNLIFMPFIFAPDKNEEKLKYNLDSITKFYFGQLANSLK